MVPCNTIEEIMQLFEANGHEDYDGEPVTQASHMIQCAMLAIHAGADDELITGALLHDIGHLLKQRQATDTMVGYGVVNHEGIGAAFLHENRFSDRVCAVVEMHVQAKRFLVATEASYKDNLSVASQETLKWQGDPMSPDEADAFRWHPFFDDIIRVRIWDEEAKDTDAELLPLNYFRHLIRKHVSKQESYEE